jgi:AcrR family transcriptional regulator
VTRRGSYAKGVAKREEILATALRVIARNGYRSTSVAELAEAVGLSQNGLLHYFGSKEELFAAVLRKRDEADAARAEAARSATGDPVAAFIEVIARNAEVPGLVQFHAHLSVDATDSGHAAHDYAADRYRRGTAALADGLRRMRDAGELPADLDPDTTATTFFALADGLQVQWLLDPSLDMAAHLTHLWRLITRTGG